MIETVPHIRIHPSPLNPRKVIEGEALAELAASIKTEGLLQNLVVRPTGGPDDGFEIAAGERRWRAIKQLIDAGDLPDDHEIPVVIRDLTDLQLLQLATTENLARADMTPMEEARAFSRMLELGSDVDTIAAETGLSTSTIKKRLALTNLAPIVLEALDAGEVTLGAAQALTNASTAAQTRIVTDMRRWGRSEPLSATAVRHNLSLNAVPVSRARFPIDRYKGEIIEPGIFADEGAEETFGDTEQFLNLQTAWAEEIAAKYRESWGWCEIRDWLPSYEFDKPKPGTSLKEQGVIIVLKSDGEMSTHEGLVKRTSGSTSTREQERDPLALTKKHLARIHELREHAAQVAIADNLVPATAILVYSLLQTYGSDAITINRHHTAKRNSDSLDAAPQDVTDYLEDLRLGPITRETLRQPRLTTRGSDVELLTELMLTPIADLSGLLTILVGFNLRAGDRYGSGRDEALFNTIWHLVEQHSRQTTPSEHLPTYRDLGADWLSLYSRARLQQVASNLLGGTAADELDGKPKKTVIAQILSRAGARLDYTPDELLLPDPTDQADDALDPDWHEGLAHDVTEYDEGELEEEEAVAV